MNNGLMPRLSFAHRISLLLQHQAGVNRKPQTPASLSTVSRFNQRRDPVPGNGLLDKRLCMWEHHRAMSGISSDSFFTRPELPQGRNVLQHTGCAAVSAEARAAAPGRHQRAEGAAWAQSRWFVLILALFCSGLCASAQNYSIDWYKISSGGGTSTGGVYSATGTIGQPDAGGAMTGGNYSLTGGFWSLIAVLQTPGAPTLTVTRSGSSVTISWPYPSSGFALQQNGSLSTTNWANSGLPVTTNAWFNTVTITPPTGNLFFRLHGQ
jgi:hypothetical protein